jgi:hypothetical protein
MLGVGSDPSSPLLHPPHRRVLPQLLQAQAIGFIAAQDRLEDSRREAGRPGISAGRAFNARFGIANGWRQQ